MRPPTDTGEAYGLSPASLTATIGLGPSLFGERFGLGARRPALFTDLPPLNGDNLDPRLHGGDLSVQACADDPQVCYHAVRNLARLGRNIVSPFWAVLGFGRASAGPGQQTPRNLLGFKDGTRNVTTEAEYARVQQAARRIDVAPEVVAALRQAVADSDALRRRRYELVSAPMFSGGRSPAGAVPHGPG